MFNFKFIVVVFILFFNQQVFAVTEKEAAEFFENYIKFSKNFDVSIKKYYSANLQLREQESQ